MVRFVTLYSFLVKNKHVNDIETSHMIEICGWKQGYYIVTNNSNQDFHISKWINNEMQLIKLFDEYGYHFITYKNGKMNGFNKSMYISNDKYQFTKSYMKDNINIYEMRY